MDVLERDELLENGSQFEVEIRGCSIHAVSLIVKQIIKTRPDCKINDILVGSVYIIYCSASTFTTFALFSG